MELGYNHVKPGRPSHNYHSFFIGRAWISLGVDIRPGEWDYCALVTNGAGTDAAALSQLYRDWGDCDATTSRPAYMSIMGRIAESGRK